MLTQLLLASALIGQGLSFHKLYFFHIALIFAACSMLKLNKIKAFFVSEKPLNVLALIATISLLWSKSIKEGILDVAYIYMGLLFIYLIAYSDIGSKKLLQVLRIVFLINLFLSVGESLDLFRFPISQYSIYAEFFGKIFIGVKDGYTVPTGFHYNPNNNALFFLVFTPLVIYSMPILPTLLLLLVTSYVVFMATSKLILVGWVIFLMIIVVIYLRKKMNTVVILSSFIGIISLLSVMMFLAKGDRGGKYSKTIPALKTFVVSAPQNVLDRMLGKDVEFNYLSFDTSVHERLTFVDGLVLTIQKNFFFGSGAGTLAVSEHTQGGRTLSLKTPHFYLLEVLAKYGILYFGLYMFWIFRIFNKVRKLSPLFALPILFFLIFSPVLSSATYFLPKWALFAFLLKVSKENLDDKESILDAKPAS